MDNREEKRSDFLLKVIFFIISLIILIIIRVYPHIGKLTADVVFKDPDTCYHARRIIYIATHNLQLPFYDPLMSHPYGEIPIWSPLYDWINAFIAYILSFGNPSDNFILKVSIILTLLFGITEVLIIMLLINKATNSISASILSFLLVGILDPQVKFTSIEIIDHNCLLAALFCLSIYLHYIFFISNRKINIFLNGLVISLLFWVWPGSYIYVSTLVLIELLYIFITKKRNLIVAISMIYFIAALLIFPLSIVHLYLGKALLSFEYVSLFTVLFLISISAGYLILEFIIRIIKGDKKSLCITFVLVLLSLLLVIIYCLIPVFIEGIKFASAENAWINTIAESKPLLYLQRGPIKEFTFSKAIDRFGYFIFVFPIIFLLILFRRIKLSIELYSILVSSNLIFSFLAFNQQKFGFEFSIPYGISLSIFIEWLYKKITSKKSVFVISIFTLIMVISFLPLNKLLKEKYTPFYGYYPSFIWLKNETNFSKTDINTGHIQKYGVIAPWDLGHHLKFYSNVPVITDNFGINLFHKGGLFDMAKFFLSEDEQEAINILKKYKSKYVVVPFSSIYEQYPPLINISPELFHEYKVIKEDGRKKIGTLPKEKFYETIGFRLSDIYGSANPYTNESLFAFRALKHFRLIHESKLAKSANQQVPIGALKIYKCVKGKKLVIPEKDDSFYKVEAIIITNTANRFYYRQYGYIKNEIIVPYPTKIYKDYPYALSYKVYVEDKVYEFNDITEEDVE